MLVFLVTIAIAMSVGLNRGLELWKQSQGQSIQDFVAAELTSAYRSGKFREGESVAEFFEPFLDPTLYLLIFNDDGDLLFWYWTGESWYEEDRSSDHERTAHDGHGVVRRLLAGGLVPNLNPDVPVHDSDLLAELQRAGEVVDLVVDGVTVAYFVAGSNGFTITPENKQLVDTVVIAVGIALFIALLTGVVISAARAHRVAVRAATVAMSLERLASGDQAASFPGTSLRELDSISRSARILKARLEEEAHLRRQWTLDIAHDLRTPLAGLRVQVEGLADGVLNPDPARYSTILAELSRVEQLTSALLLLTKVESPDFRLDIRPIQISQLATALEHRFGDRLAAAGRTLEVRAEPGLIQCDEGLVLRALSNLVDNAVHYGLGRVFVHLSADGMRVCNEGRMSAEVLRHAFDRLYRGTPERSGSGHGLGLAIARSIVDRHGWRIAASEADGMVCVAITMEPHMSNTMRPSDQSRM